MNNGSDPLARLFERVVDGGYCIGCGACAAVAGSPVQTRVDDFGCIQPYVARDVDCSPDAFDLRRVCPFSGTAPNEDEIGRGRFAAGNADYDERIGYHLGVFAAYVREGDYRRRGSSGGIATWCVAELLKTGQIDGVMHVHSREPDAEDQRLFHYQLSTTLEQICANTKSQYYPIEMSRVVREIRNRPGRYAFIGIPCFVKAMRLLQQHDPVLGERVVYCISLVCGHLKSMRWTDLLGWQVGIDPGTISRIGFREKVEGRPANEYHFKLEGKHGGREVTELLNIRSVLGGDWSQCFFMYTACDYCDDVVGETADLSVGDAWLPQYSGDYRGTNLVIARHPDLLDLIRAAADGDRIHLEPLSVEQAVQSQAGGLRHRRQGLAYRLWLKESAGQWYPRRRVEPRQSHIGSNRQSLFRLRMEISRLSHSEFRKAVKTNDLKAFLERLRPLAVQYKRLKRSPGRFIIGPLKRVLKRIKRIAPFS